MKMLTQYGCSLPKQMMRYSVSFDQMPLIVVNRKETHFSENLCVFAWTCASDTSIKRPLWFIRRKHRSPTRIWGFL